MNMQHKTKGFTIIEVVLVLAIAGLIFLMVFLALPALQRSQRDTQRRDDLSRFASAYTSARSNTGGTSPFTFSATTGVMSAAPTTFVTGYLTNGGSNFNDPGRTAAYQFTTTGVTTAVPSVDNNGVTTDNIGEIAVYQTAQSTGCNGALPAANGSKVVAVMFLENGGSICQYL